MVQPNSIDFQPFSPLTEQKYLKPSVFWSIRQGFPRSLALLLIGVSLVVPLALWALMTYTGWASDLFLPSPTAVIGAGIQMFRDEDLLWDVLVSSARVLGGFVLAAIIGFPIGIAMGTFYSMEHLFAPIVGALRSIPIPALVPLIIIWVGIGEWSKLLIIVLGVVLYNAIIVADAVRFIPSEMINVAYTLGASRREVLWRVIVPATIPTILDTLRVGISGAWNFLTIAELIAAERGLGFKIMQQYRQLNTDKVLFCIVVIGVIGVLTDYFLKWLSNRLTPWADQTRH